MSLYLRLAEVLERAHAVTSDLRFLSALLKCMDTLSASVERLNGSERGRLASLIEAEYAHVAEVGSKVGAAP
jgi:hypothetical protein